MGETTCDGKKKMFEIMEKLKPVHLLQLPYRAKGDGAAEFWLDQIKEFGRFLSGRTGQEVEPEELRRQIKIHNRIRQAYLDISDLMKTPAPPLTGLQMMNVTDTKNLYFQGRGPFGPVVRVPGAGPSFPGRCPCPGPPGSSSPAARWAGARKRSCGWWRKAAGWWWPWRTAPGSKASPARWTETQEDPYLALAEYYLETPCSCMTPNEGRLELVARLARDYKADGIIDLTWLYCHTYNVEAVRIKNLVKETLAVPYLQLETDYSQTDLGNLRIRVEAFLEMVSQR